MPHMFYRRLDTVDVHNRLCTNACNCPAIWELQSGDFAVIGADITAESAEKLPPTSGCGPGERVVRIPRTTLVSARHAIPEMP